MRVDFYHLAASPIERVLPRIAERVLTDGGRMLVVGDDEPLLARVDEALWGYTPEGFLPHGRAGGEGAESQPILLAPQLISDHPATVLALIDGHWRDAALAYPRTLHFFDDARLAEARAAWRLLVQHDDVERRFWKQDAAGQWAQAG